MTPETAPLAEQLRGAGDVATLDGRFRFRPRAEFRLSDFYARAEALGLSPRQFNAARPTLEAVFLHLTGRTLRE